MYLHSTYVLFRLTVLEFNVIFNVILEVKVCYPEDVYSQNVSSILTESMMGEVRSFRPDNSIR